MFKVVLDCKVPSIFFSGVHPSPLGISLVVLLVIGSIYYLVMFHSPASLQAVSMKEMLIAGIDFAERGGVQVNVI